MTKIWYALDMVRLLVYWNAINEVDRRAWMHVRECMCECVCSVQVDNAEDADIVVIPYWVDLLCRMSQESDALWKEFNEVRHYPTNVTNAGALQEHRRHCDICMCRHCYALFAAVPEHREHSCFKYAASLAHPRLLYSVWYMSPSQSYLIRTVCFHSQREDCDSLMRLYPQIVCDLARAGLGECRMIQVPVAVGNAQLHGIFRDGVQVSRQEATRDICRPHGGRPHGRVWPE